MKEIDELHLPADVRYSEDHEWALADGGLYRVGISDYAQDQLGDIVFVELPEVGAQLDRGEEFGTVESVKAVSELYMPLAGEIVEVNAELEESPELLNTDPYEGGWIINIKIDDAGDYEQLMDSDAYLAMIKAAS